MGEYQLQYAKQKVSVIIPLYNHEKYIEEAINSVIKQTFVPIEIIVIDDGSNDNSAELMKQLTLKHNIIKFYSRENRGAHNTINEAIKMSQGDYIAILNSDDIYYSDRLAQCLRVFNDDEMCDAVATDITFIDANSCRVKNKWYEESKTFYSQIKNMELALMNANFIMTTSNIVFKRTIYKEIGGFSDFRYAHDLDFFLRLLVNKKKIVFLDKPLLNYRMHESNTISENHKLVRLEWAAIVAYYMYKIMNDSYCGQDTCIYIEKFSMILKKHSLQNLVFAFWAYFAEKGLDMNIDCYKSDKAFCNLLQELEK